MQPDENAAAGRADTSNAAGWYALAVLVLAYTCSYIDRTILTLLVKPIRASLQISDVQFSLLHGFAFAIFYTGLGIPIARLADRSIRVRLISAGVVVWSVMTVLCGAARGFAGLFIARVGVGVGEAALSPAAYSMLSDYFRGSALARALSLYSAAVYVGGGLALIVGGAVIASVSAVVLPIVGHVEPWQMVFFLVGLLGLPVALLMLTVREPARRGLAPGVPAAQLPFRSVLAWMSERRGSYYLLIGALSLLSLVWNGSTAWIPSFFIRHYGWSPSDVGFRYGMAMLCFGGGGVVSGGLISSWLRARGHVDANIIVCVLSAMLLLPAGVLAPLLGDPMHSLAMYALFLFAGSMPYGCAAAAFQDLTPNQMRAQVTAVYLLVLNMAGIGLGPTVVAAITEHVIQDEADVGKSLALLCAVFTPVAAALLALARAPYRRELPAGQE